MLFRVSVAYLSTHLTATDEKNGGSLTISSVEWTVEGIIMHPVAI